MNKTNGDMVRTMFPDILTRILDNTVYTDLDNGVWFSLDWWNAPYNGESEEEKENLCDSCTTNGCSLQSGIARNHCDFYTSQKSEE